MRSDTSSTRALHLFTTIDATWLSYALMFIASVRKQTECPISYTIFCSSPLQEAELQEWGNAHGIVLNVVDFERERTRRNLDDFLDLRVPLDGISACAYWGRYCASYLMKSVPVRLIYVDVDMFAVGDLSPLMAVDLRGLPVGAVRYPDDAKVERSGVPAGQYVNNGLLVFDTDLFEGRVCVMEMQRALGTGLPVFGPQCAFNMAMRERIAILDPMWNVQGEWRAELHEVAKLIHFTGNTKPWHTLSADPLRRDVRSLLREIGCANAWRPDISVSKYLRLVRRNVLSSWGRF